MCMSIMKHVNVLPRKHGRKHAQSKTGEVNSKILADISLARNLTHIITSSTDRARMLHPYDNKLGCHGSWTNLMHMD